MPGGRPPYSPTDKERGMVRTMTGFGIPKHEIARLLKIDGKTLNKHFDQELATGQTEATAKVAASLFRKATGDGQGSVVAAIFWLKCRAGWRDHVPPVPNGENAVPPDRLGKKARALLKAQEDPEGPWGELMRRQREMQ